MSGISLWAYMPASALALIKSHGWHDDSREWIVTMAKSDLERLGAKAPGRLPKHLRERGQETGELL